MATDTDRKTQEPNISIIFNTVAKRCDRYS